LIHDAQGNTQTILPPSKDSRVIDFLPSWRTHRHGIGHQKQRPHRSASALAIAIFRLHAELDLTDLND
jgi:hypothetical protein